MDNNKNYYVYIWIREDYNTIFYVGKGKNDRAKTIKGNIHFKRIYEKVPTHYELIYTNLTEKEAFDLEKETIHKLVYEDGYSIQAKAYEGREIKGRHLVNCTFGGEGVSGHKLKKMLNPLDLESKMGTMAKKENCINVMVFLKQKNIKVKLDVQIQEVKKCIV